MIYIVYEIDSGEKAASISGFIFAWNQSFANTQLESA